jgi:catalase (peroxidase I)
MKHLYELQQELNDTHSSYVNLMQNRLNYCVETERYEMVARLRNLIKYETTEDEEYKNQYYLELLKSYAPEHPEFYEKIKKNIQN